MDRSRLHTFTAFCSQTRSRSTHSRILHARYTVFMMPANIEPGCGASRSDRKQCTPTAALKPRSLTQRQVLKKRTADVAARQLPVQSLIV